MPTLPLAEHRDRFAAFCVDALPGTLAVVATYGAGWGNAATLLVLAQCAWLVARDALFRGRSPGKRRYNLQVLDAGTRRLPTTHQALLRNALYGVPGLNAILAVADGVRIILRDDRSRWGDDWAGTDVVHLTPEIVARIARELERDPVPATLRLLHWRMGRSPLPAPADEETTAPAPDAEGEPTAPADDAADETTAPPAASDDAGEAPSSDEEDPADPSDSREPAAG